MQNTLSSFIAHARDKGMDHQTIRMLLLSAGWKEKDISSALASETLDMPVPTPVDAGSARDAFFHLLAFTTLYSTVISLIILAYQWIGRTFADAAFSSTYYSYDAESSVIRWSLAVILVSFPLFVYLSRTLHRESVGHPEKLASGVRRWLTYLTLFVTACTIAGDLITLLFFLLQGELTVRFILKVLAVLVLTGVPFLYYLRSMRLDAKSYTTSPIHGRYLTVASALVLLGVLWAFMAAGSPMYGRMQRLDEKRVSDIQTIQTEMLNYLYGSARWDSAVVTKLPKPLPSSLDELAKNVTYQKLETADPATGEPYEYIPSGNTYKICAVFDLAKDESYNVFWNHPVGHHCFTFNALDRQGK
jgi:hypothetical protein